MQSIVSIKSSFRRFFSYAKLSDTAVQYNLAGGATPKLKKEMKVFQGKEQS